MSGINLVINEDGLNTAILIDLNVLKQNRTSGREVTAWLETLEDIEDIIDVELSGLDESEDWNEVKKQLKKSGKLSAHV